MNENAGMRAALRAIAEHAPLRREEIVARELENAERSPARRWMDIGAAYYRGEHDIEGRRRTSIGEDGRPAPAANLSDKRIAHCFLRELCEQKCQYLLGKPFAWRCEDEKLYALLERRMDERFAALLMRTCKDAIVQGIGWIHLHYDEKGALRMRRMPPEEMIPLWADEEHERLDAMLRRYRREEYAGGRRQLVDCVTLWDDEGVWHWRRERGALRPDDACGSAREPHFVRCEEGETQRGRWGQLPFVALRYNDEEQPLIRQVKGMIDEYDAVVSNFANALEDQPNSILVLRNYDGQNLGEFRRNLATYRAVKVTDDGGLEALQTPLEHAAVTAHLERLRRDIYALGRGIDHRTERIAAASSGVALRYEYAALDMDSSALERHCRKAFAQLLDFWMEDALRRGEGPFADRRAQIVFNRDVISNEAEAIEMVARSEGLISRETLLANHPWVENVVEEKARREQEEGLGGLRTVKGEGDGGAEDGTK